MRCTAMSGCACGHPDLQEDSICTCIRTVPVDNAPRVEGPHRVSDTRGRNAPTARSAIDTIGPGNDLRDMAIASVMPTDSCRRRDPLVDGSDKPSGQPADRGRLGVD